MLSRLALVAVVLCLLVAGPVAASSGMVPANGEATRQKSQALEPKNKFSYDQLYRAIKKRQVKQAVLNPKRFEVRVVLKDKRDYTIIYPPAQDSVLADKLAASGAKVSVESVGSRGGSQVASFIFTALLIGMVIGAVMWYQRRHTAKGPPGGGGLRSDTKLGGERPEVRFRDVAGCDEAVEEIGELVEFLQHPYRFLRVGARSPKGALLHGPPGTGKTLLAKAVAGEAGVDFFAASGSDFAERYVGVGASRMRELFTKAAKSDNGAVIFIDEIDAIGRKRGGSESGGNEERENTLIELLNQLDGFPDNQSIICLAATNRPEILDPALLRPGRFSRQIHIDLPSAEGRLEILKIHTMGKPLAEDVDLAQLAEETAGSSGADLADMTNEGAIMAARAGRQLITQADLEEGHLRALAGPEKRSNIMNTEERDVVANHEAGHALVAEFCEEHESTNRLTIKPRGRAAGLAIPMRRDRTLHSAQYIHEQLMVLLGGRAAEDVVYGRVSSGAANDLQKANAIARRAVTELGLSPRTGQLVGANEAGQPVHLSDSTRQVVDEEVERMIADAYADSLDMIREHRSSLNRLAAQLLLAEDLDRGAISAALGQGRPSIVRSHPGPQGRPALRPAPVDKPARRKTRQSGRQALAGAATALISRRRRRPASSD